mgnify:CR=1 FL=1
MNKTKCPICGEMSLISKSELEETQYGNSVKSLALHFSECEACGSELATAEQAKENKRLMQAFKKEVDGLLAGSEIKAFRKRHALTQAQSAKIFGGGKIAFSKYEANDVSQSEAMDKLIRVADKFPAVLSWLKSSSGLEFTNKK